MFRTEAFRLRVPASSANVGPGYDCFGLALAMYDEVVVRVTAQDLKVDVSGEGADQVSRDERNLVVRAMFTAFDQIGGRPPGLEVRCSNRIPHGRGLGSSAAAIVVGIAASRALTVDGEERLDDASCLAVATQMEGHPDNIAAATYGGFTVAWDGHGSVGVLQLQPHHDIVLTAFVSSVELSTAKARQALPSTVPHAHAAANSAHAAMMVEAMTRRPDLLMTASHDFLHQEYRRPVMPGSLKLIDELRSDGIAAVMSGAGPTVLAITDAEHAAGLQETSREGWTAMAMTPDLAGVQVQPL